MTKTIIKHHTKNHALTRIFCDRFVGLEGISTMRGLKNCVGGKKHYKEAKAKYKITGRYVWLTEEDHANSAVSMTGEDTYPFSFFAEDIGARKWSEVKKTKPKKVRDHFSALEAIAKAFGDDPDKWWVCTKNINLEHWLSGNDARTVEMLFKLAYE